MDGIFYKLYDYLKGVESVKNQTFFFEKNI